MSTSGPDPLLTPTLTEEDDTVGFDQPWNPWALVAFTFFFGIIGGGGLLASNYRKLGVRGRADGVLVGSILLGVLMVVAVTWAVGGGLFDRSDVQARITVRMVVRVLSVGLALAIALTQQKRWRLFQTTGLPQGKLLGPGFHAALGSKALEYVVALGALQLFGLR